MTRPRTELTGPWAARALAAGREVWLLTDSSASGRESLHGGTESEVRAALEEYTREPWPPEWSLRRVFVASGEHPVTVTTRGEAYQ